MVDEVRTGTYRQLFHPEQLISGKEDETTPPAVEWIEHEHLSAAAKTACEIAQRHGLGVILGRRQIGVRKKRSVAQDASAPQPRTRIWKFLGVPHDMCGDDVISLATEAGFKDVKVLDYFRWRKGKGWTVKATRQDQTSHLEIVAGETTIMASSDFGRVDRRPHQALPSERKVSLGEAAKLVPAKQPRFPLSVKATGFNGLQKPDAMDVDADQTPRDAAAVAQPADNTERSSPPPKKAKVVKPPPGLELIRNAGQGNCLFHAVSDACKIIGQSRGHGVLRAMTVTHLRKYKEAYEATWDMCTPDAEGKPMDAADFEKYLDMLAADGAWGGALEITALANTLNVSIRVFTADTTYVFNDSGKKGTLMLHFYGSHFEAMKGQIRSAEDWGKLTPGPRVGLRAGGKTSSSSGTASSVKKRLCKGQASSGKEKDSCGTASSVRRLLQEKAQSVGTASAVKRDLRLQADKNQTSRASPPHCNGKDIEPNAENIWVCDECQQPLSAATISKLSKKRDNHIRKVHADISRSRFHNLYEPAGIIAASHHIEWKPGVWECAGCGSRITEIENRHQKAISIAAHLRQCPHVTAQNKNASANNIALIKKYGGTAKYVRVLKPNKGGIQHANLSLHKVATQFRELHELRKKTDHDLRRVERESTSGRKKKTDPNAAYTCANCLQVWKWATYLRIDISEGTSCKGSVARSANLRSLGTRQFYRKGSLSLQNDLKSIWGLSEFEKKAFTLTRKKLQRHCGPGPLAECRDKRRQATIVARRTERALWVSRHLREARRKKLVEEGVEPNPGPSGLKLLTLNIDGENNLWGFLRSLERIPQKPDLIALQELSFSPANIGRMASRAQHVGFRFIFQPCQAPDRQGRVHGTGWLTKSNLPVIPAGSFGDKTGQAASIEICGLHLVSFWRSPGDKDCSDLWNFVESVHISAGQRKQGFVLVGDFNYTPEENYWALSPDLQILAWHDETGNFGPTRWQGHRCIDYCLMSLTVQGEANGFWDEKFSDHKAMLFTIHHDVYSLRHKVATPTPGFAKLFEAPDIHNIVRKAWNFQNCTIPAQIIGNSDAEWLWFSALVEKTLFAAASIANAPPRGGLRAKGTGPTFVDASDERLASSRCGNYVERSLRKLLGRLHEVNRQRRCGRPCAHLLEKIHRAWPTGLPWQGVEVALQQIEQQLAEQIRHDKLTALAAWRANLHAGGKKATNWLKGSTHLPTPTVLKLDGACTKGPEEALCCIRGFWQKIWSRPCDTPRLQELQSLITHGSFRNPLPANQDSWVPTAETLQQRACQMRGSASGLDGWAADELAILPIEVFQLFRSLVLEWGRRRIWPSTWCDVRQVHLPKDPTEPLRPVQPKDLRPISIFSTWYRLLTGAFMSQDVVRNWIVQVLPAQAHGGVSGRWIATAFHEILAQLDAGGCALGLDFAKCFDRVDPRLVIAHFRLHQWPEAVTSLLEHVWLDQHRFLQLGRSTLEIPTIVRSSLPQGDPISPLGLLLVLSDAISDVSSLPGVSQATFLDDRFLVAHDVPHLLRAQKQWSMWSARTGLAENGKKTICFAQTYHQRMAFLRRGFPAEQIRDEARILGVDFFAPGTRDVGQCQNGRLQEGLGIAARITRAPVPISVREMLFRTRVIPKISWGWWFNDVPDRVLNRCFSIFRKVADVHHMASRPLRQLLQGHAFSFRFMAFQQSLVALRAAALAGLQWSDGRGSWICRVSGTLASWNWTPVAPWCWHHDQEGDFNLRADEKDSFLHKIRESWRRDRWEHFCQQNRRDSRLFTNEPYSKERRKEAMRLFGRASQHGKAVLTGAANSLSCYQVMYENNVTSGCDLCTNSNVFPDWHHLVWSCPAFARGRPPEPQDRMQCRFAWPPNSANRGYNEAVLNHMAAVRAQVMTFSPSSRGRRSSTM